MYDVLWYKRKSCTTRLKDVEVKRRMDRGERIRAEMDGWVTTDEMMMDVVQSGSSSNSRITWIVMVCVKNCLRWVKTRRVCQPLQKEEKGYHKGILWLLWKIISLLYNNNSNNWRRATQVLYILKQWWLKGRVKEKGSGVAWRGREGYYMCIK